MQYAGETKHFHACINENYIDKGKGHLNHQKISVKNEILLEFPVVETILQPF
jgi:hypothetical protein